MLISKAADRPQASTPSLEHRWWIRTDLVHRRGKKRKPLYAPGSTRAYVSQYSPLFCAHSTEKCLKCDCDVSQSSKSCSCLYAILIREWDLVPAQLHSVSGI